MSGQNPSSDVEEISDFEDNSDRAAVEQFVRVGRQLGATADVEAEVTEIMDSVDSSKRFTRKVREIQWHEGYYSARDNYRGKYAEGGDPAVLFNPRERLERFVTTKSDEVTVIKFLKRNIIES